MNVTNHTNNTPATTNKKAPTPPNNKAITIALTVATIALIILGVTVAILIPVSFPFVLMGLGTLVIGDGIALSTLHIANVKKAQATLTQEAELQTTTPSHSKALPLREVLTQESPAAEQHKAYIEQLEGEVKKLEEKIKQERALGNNPKAHMDKKSTQDHIEHFTNQIKEKKTEILRATEAAKA